MVAENCSPADGYIPATPDYSPERLQKSDNEKENKE